MTSSPCSWGAGQSPSEAAAIYARSLGLPLFTEQLAARASVSVGGGPALLGDLLDARLGDLAGTTWRLARALGVADRPLTSDVVAAAAGLSADELTEVLHTLAGRHLLADTTDSTVMLRHPLLAKRSDVAWSPARRQAQHENIAQALALSTTPVPAEVAGHWAAAGERGAGAPMASPSGVPAPTSASRCGTRWTSGCARSSSGRRTSRRSVTHPFVGTRPSWRPWTSSAASTGPREGTGRGRPVPGAQPALPSRQPRCGNEPETFSPRPMIPSEGWISYTEHWRSTRRCRLVRATSVRCSCGPTRCAGWDGTPSRRRRRGAASRWRGSG